jgi:hypothetical protein
MESMFLE